MCLRSYCKKIKGFLFKLTIDQCRIKVVNVYIHLQYNKVIHFTCIFPGYSQAAEHLQSFIADCDRRTELAKKRLAETQDEISAEVAAKVKTQYLI